MFRWLTKVFHKDTKNGLREDILQTIKALHGKNWKQKVKPHKLKAIPFDKSFLRRYDKLMQEYLKETFTMPLQRIISDIKNTSNTRQDDSTIAPNVEVGNGFITQIEQIEIYASEALITFSVLIKEIGKDMLEQNNTTFAKQLHDAFGFTPDFEKDPIYRHLNSWVDENVRLIKRIDVSGYTNVKSIVSNNFRNGGRHENMIKELAKVKHLEE
jgi:hypothetical protein